MNFVSEPVDDLRASEIRYRRLFESARDGILILDATSRKITDANPYMTDLLDYPRDYFLDKELWEIGMLKDEEESAAAFQQLQENGYIRYENLPGNRANPSYTDSHRLFFGWWHRESGFRPGRIQKAAGNVSLKLANYQVV